MLRALVLLHSFFLKILKGQLFSKVYNLDYSGKVFILLSSKVLQLFRISIWTKNTIAEWIWKIMSNSMIFNLSKWACGIHLIPESPRAANERSERGRSALFKNPLFFWGMLYWGSTKFYWGVYKICHRLGTKNLPH